MAKNTETSEELPELKKYRLGQRIVRGVVGVGLGVVAIVKTALGIARGDASAAISGVKAVASIAVGAIDDPAKKANVPLAQRVFRALGGAIVFGLSATTTVFKAMKGDVMGALGDVGTLVMSGISVINSITPFFATKSKEEKPPTRLGIIIAKIMAAINGVPDRIANKLEQSRGGRIFLRVVKAAYKIATSKHVKIALQVVTTVLAVASATTPIGWAVAGLSLAALTISGIKSYLHTRSDRHLNEKREALIDLKNERAEQSRLISQNPILQPLAGKIIASDKKGLDKVSAGEAPQRVPINLGREVFSAVASSLAGGAAAIVDVIGSDPTKQAATAFVLLGGVSREVEGNIKKEISRDELKQDIWQKGGGDKSLAQVQAQLLAEKRQGAALKWLLQEAEADKSIDGVKVVNMMEGRLQELTKVASKLLYPSPTVKEKITSAFKGLRQDAKVIVLDDVTQGWRELRGEVPKVSDEPKAHVTASESARTSSEFTAELKKRVSKAPSAFRLEPEKSPVKTENITAKVLPSPSKSTPLKSSAKQSLKSEGRYNEKTPDISRSKKRKKSPDAKRISTEVRTGISGRVKAEARIAAKDATPLITKDIGTPTPHRLHQGKIEISK